jgi:hypothetical protein
MLDPYRVHETHGARDRGRRSRGPSGRASLCPRLQMLRASGPDDGWCGLFGLDIGWCGLLGLDIGWCGLFGLAAV